MAAVERATVSHARVPAEIARLLKDDSNFDVVRSTRADGTVYLQRTRKGRGQGAAAKPRLDALRRRLRLRDL